MAGGAQLTVEQGPETGRIFPLLPGGSARIGRSHSNDIALNDPSISRFHCRIFFKPNGELWVSDLGSANETLVNNTRIQEKQVSTGDRITVGDTTLRVDLTPVVAGAAAVDLGLGAPAKPPKKEGSSRGARLVLLCAAAALAGAAALFVWMSKLPASKEEPTAAAPAKTAAGPLEINFERVSGSRANIFRFSLEISDGKASIAVDDIANNRHFEKPMTEVRPEVLAGLAESLRNSGFFDLEPQYSTHRTDVYELCDLSVSIGAQTHRTVVLNSAAPPAFETAVKTVEEFGINEFGIRALSRSNDELVSMAGESLALARKLSDERNVRYENLFLAVKAFKEAEVYLETIDPKPDFYAGAMAERRKCEEELGKVYSDLRFQADKAIKLKDWTEAARVLQIVCATVPDRSHEWHKQAEQQLLDVQRRVEK